MKLPTRLQVINETKDGFRVARCPELGLMATATTEKEAFNRLVDLITAQISYAAKTGRMGEIFRSTRELSLKKNREGGFDVMPVAYAPA